MASPRSESPVSGQDAAIRDGGGALRRWGWSVWVGLTLLGVLFWGDDWLRAQRAFMASKVWNTLAQLLSGSANGNVLIPAALVGVLWLVQSGRRMAARALMVCLLAGVVAGVVGTTLRSVIGRARPEVGVEQGWFGPRKDGRWIIGRHAYSAFPSGHASIAAGFGVMAFGWRRRAGGIGVVYALAVAWSRFHLGAHRASDVGAGLMVGALTAALMWPRCRTWVNQGVLPASWPLRWKPLAEPSAGTAAPVSQSQG